MIDETFWLELGISPRNIENFKPSNIKNFKEKIIGCSADIELLNSFFQSKINVKDDKSIKELLIKPKIKEFYGLFNYSIGKLDTLREFFSGEGLLKKYIDTPLLGLIYLYETSKNKLIDSYSYFLYNRAPISEIWVCEPALSPEIIEKFRSQIGKLSEYTKKYKLGKNRLNREFFNNNCFYFCFEKAKREDVAIGYQERKPIRRRGVYYIKFNIEKNNLEIRTGNPRISDLFSSILKEIEQKVYVVQSIETDDNLKEIMSKIISNSFKTIKIREFVFNSLEKGVNCQTIFRQTDQNTPLINSLLPMREENFIDPKNINNLNSFTVDISGFTQTIKIEREINTISFRLTKKGLSETKYQQIVTAIKDEIGIELKKDYPKDDSNLPLAELFKNIIGKIPTSLSLKEREVYAMMTVKGIIDCNSQSNYLCEDDDAHRFSTEYKKCPKCGGALQKLVLREIIQVNKEKLLTNILDKLKNIFGAENVSSIDLKFGKSECKLIFVNDKKNEFYLYYDCGQRLTKKIESLEDSIMPVIKIVLDNQIKTKGIKIGPQIYAYNLIFDTEEQIKKDIEDRIISKYTNLLLTKSRESETSLIEIANSKRKVSGDEFEDLTFPIIRSCFYGIYKWGKNNKGNPVPDGLCGIKRPNKKTGFSMIYDCKYSDSEYDLDIDEKRKAKEYIRRSNQSKEIRLFSKKLSSYLIISNSISPKKFNLFAEDIFKYKGWKGKILLLDIKDLIYLFNEFKKRDSIHKYLKMSFCLAFIEKIENINDRKIILDKNLIDEVLKETDSKSNIIDQVEVLDFLKTGIEY